MSPMNALSVRVHCWAWCTSETKLVGPLSEMTPRILVPRLAAARITSWPPAELPTRITLLEITTQVFNVGCLVAWIFALGRTGEIQPRLEPLLPGEKEASFAVVQETADDIAAAAPVAHRGAAHPAPLDQT